MNIPAVDVRGDQDGVAGLGGVDVPLPSLTGHLHVYR